MLAGSLLGIEDLIVFTPGLLARLGMVNYDQAKAQKLLWDYFDTEDAEEQADLARPFFVLQEAELDYSLINEQELIGVCAVDVIYTEKATFITDHKTSKLHFISFVGSMIQSMADRQNQPIAGNDLTSYIAISRIQMIEQARRTPKSQRDTDRPLTDSWWCKWRMFVGDLRGAG
jgi:hypothetical protein